MTTPVRSRHALVTGAAGFIGRHLIRELASSGWAITGLVRNSNQLEIVSALGATAVVGDLRDASLELGSLDPKTVVFHLAADLTTLPQGVADGQLIDPQLHQ